MTCSWRHAAGLGLLSLACTALACAQAKVFVAGAVYEGPDLVAPEAVLVLPAAESGPAGPSARSWSASLLGSTLSADTMQSLSRHFGILLGASAAPSNANASHWIYSNGKHETRLSFTDSAYQARAGVRLEPVPGWRSEVQLLVLKESVSGIDNRFWSNPYAGIEVTQSYRRAVAEDLLRSRFEGFEVAATAQSYFGPNTWSRFRLAVAGGKQFGHLFLRGQAVAFDGHSLNAVSRFLVGGSWDGSDALPLYGFHYAQFRADRGVIVNGGVDVRLRGTSEVGIRAGHLDSPGKSASGMALRIGAMWNGIAWNAGVGLPGSVSDEPRGDAFVFAAFRMAFIR